MVTRREFLDTLAVGAAGWRSARPRRATGRSLGSNDRLNFAVIGLNSRAYAHLSALKANKADGAHLARVRCGQQHAEEVRGRRRSRRWAKRRRRTRTSAKSWQRRMWTRSPSPRPTTGIRRWRSLGLQAGKHVYVEKPCSHNPAEGALLVEAQQKYGKLVQMGTQQRSSPHTIEIVDKIHNGLIGRAYYAKAWYSNVRKSIGIGKEAPVPPQLDWDLWQGPAPRQAVQGQCAAL